MTPQQILDRLNAEFPERQVSFNVQITTSRREPMPIEIWVVAKVDGVWRQFPCASLEDGIGALKANLGELTPEMELTV